MTAPADTPGQRPAVAPGRFQNKLRVCRAAPFCWQHKAALRFIRESFDAEKTVASALAVYLALTEIASDDESETFITTHAWIAQKCGVSPRTVQDRLNRLAEIGLVEIQTPALKSPSTYRLLPVSQPLPNVRQRKKIKPLPSSEEQKKKEFNKVKIIKPALTNLTASAVSMERIAREIAGDEHGWNYDNCKVKPGKIVPASIKNVLLPYTGQLAETVIHDCWREAVERTHRAAVDGLAKTPVAYCVACFRELLTKATIPP